MPQSTGVDRYTRMESFLDNIERVEEPMNLEEPFRSLWMRIHGDMPTLMSDEDMKVIISRGFSGHGLSGVELESSEGFKLDGVGGGEGASIEVVSPSDVGPTLEMKVEDKKVKFKAAGEEELKVLKSKEDAAQKVVSVQKLTSTLKGIGGDAAKVIESVRGMAISYRDGRYDDVISKAGDIEERMGSDDMKRSVLVQLQKKISDYEEIGGDLAMAKERFKELVESLKEDKKDFYQLAQAANKMAEDSIKDLVTIEDVELAEPAVLKEEQKKEPEPVEEEKTKVVRRKVVKKKPELPGDAQKEVEPAAVEPEEEPKPVIRIVKKQVVVLRTRDEDEEDEDEDFSLDLDEELHQDDEEDEISIQGKAKDEGSVEEVKKQVDVPSPAPEETDKPGAEETPIETPVKKEEPAPETAVKDDKPEENPVEGPSKVEVEGAFKQYQFVYNAAVKLHSSGKDVTQIFDLYSYGEGARQKGDMNVYIGVGKQLQDMLISLQK